MSTEWIRGFALVDHPKDHRRVSVWLVAYDNRLAKNVNARVIDFGDPADESFYDLTWRQLLTLTPGSALQTLPTKAIRAPEVTLVCDEFIRAAHEHSLVDLVLDPEPTDPRLAGTERNVYPALDFANYLTSSWNFWIRAARRSRRRNDPPAPVLPPGVLADLKMGSVRLAGEDV